jgi:hypothetical protein
VASSVGRLSVIGADARVGPFAVLDEGTEVPDGAVVGAAAGRPPDSDPPGGNTRTGAR